jgi:Short C-terminal domain
MPRMLRRAAVIGATAHLASNRAQAQAEAAQQQDAAAGQPAGAPAPAPAVTSAEDPYGDLMKLKELLDAGALTQEEFDAQKQRILSA